MTLMVWRRGELLPIEGELRADSFYYTNDGNPAVGPGGPPSRRTTDGFSRSWSSWYETQVKNASTGSKILGKALDGIDDPTIAAMGFLNVFHSREHVFMEGLFELRVAKSRDDIILVGQRLEEMTELLDKKWKTLDDQDNSIDARTKKIAEEIRKDLDDTIDRATENNKDITQVLAQAIKQYASSATSPTPTTGSVIADTIIGHCKPVVAHAITFWEARNLRDARRASSYRELIKSETKILVLFTEVRDDVRTFLEDNDHSQAEAAFAAAKKSMDGFVGKAKTSGQKADASEFRDHAREKLAEHLRNSADIYREFVERHEEKFFGPLGPDVRDALVETRIWEHYSSLIAGYSMDYKLRQWHTKATSYFEVDLSPLPTDARRELKDGLRGILDELIREMKEAGKQHKHLVKLLGDEREQLKKNLE